MSKKLMKLSWWDRRLTKRVIKKRKNISKIGKAFAVALAKEKKAQQSLWNMVYDKLGYKDNEKCPHMTIKEDDKGNSYVFLNQKKKSKKGKKQCSSQRFKTK